jgi:hypothetical protein
MIAAKGGVGYGSGGGGGSSPTGSGNGAGGGAGASGYGTSVSATDGDLVGVAGFVRGGAGKSGIIVIVEWCGIEVT